MPGRETANAIGDDRDGVAVVAPALFLPILVGPRETAVVPGVGAVLALLAVGVAAMVLLEHA